MESAIFKLSKQLYALKRVKGMHAMTCNCGRKTNDFILVGRNALSRATPDNMLTVNGVSPALIYPACPEHIDELHTAIVNDLFCD